MALCLAYIAQTACRIMLISVSVCLSVSLSTLLYIIIAKHIYHTSLQAVYKQHNNTDGERLFTHTNSLPVK